MFIIVSLIFSNSIGIKLTIAFHKHIFNIYYEYLELDDSPIYCQIEFLSTKPVFLKFREVKVKVKI